MPEDHDDFYIGYQKKSSPSLGRSTRKRVLGVVGLVTLLALSLATLQSQFSPGIFEFGTYRTFEGIVLERPYPTLLVERPDSPETNFPYSRYLLVNPFKFGADESVAGFNGKKVTLEGQRVYQDGKTMIEVVPESVTAKEGGPSSAPALPVREMGLHKLQGEIVDSKCYLGVMNPGNLKTHKACAVRCISGGIPPVFLVRKEDGAAVYFLLVDPEGDSVNQEVLPMVADPLEIEGQVKLEGGMLVLYADPSTYVRL